MKAIYKRELRSYFHTMIGYVFIAFLVAFTGIYFMAYNLNYGYPYFNYVLSGTMFVYLIAVPILTMRSFAEDRKNKTDQLLFTAPISLTKVVFGKYFAMVTILAVPNIIYLLFPLIISFQGTAYIKIDYLAILMFFLMGCTFLSIGMFISSLTESTILAAIGSFGSLLLVYLWDGVLEFLPSSAPVNAFGLLLILFFLILGIYKMTENWFLSAVLVAASCLSVLITYLLKSEIFENLLADVLGKCYLYEPFTNITSNSLFDVSGVILYLSVTSFFLILTIE